MRSATAARPLDLIPHLDSSNPKPDLLVSAAGFRGRRTITGHNHVFLHRLQAIFLVVFWTLNALEKFGLLGKPHADRIAQISAYLAEFGIPQGHLTSLAGVTLVLFGVVEAAAAVLACLAILTGPGKGFLTACYVVALGLFLAFITGDVVAAGSVSFARMELMEHTVYFVAFLALLTGIKISACFEGLAGIIGSIRS